MHASQTVVSSALNEPVLSTATPARHVRAPATLAGWIIFCSFCNCVGWILSAAHHLDRGGYSVAITIAALLILFWKRIFAAPVSTEPLRKVRRRFGRMLPLCFVVLS